MRLYLGGRCSFRIGSCPCLFPTVLPVGSWYYGAHLIFRTPRRYHTHTACAAHFFDFFVLSQGLAVAGLETFMMNDLKTQKETLRAQAKKARGLLSLDAQGHVALCSSFFDVIDINENTVVGGYWPKGRELDTQPLIEKCLEQGAKIALPVIQKGSRILRFARWHNGMDLVEGAFGVCHPVINDDTQWLEPDVFLVPLLAFDRRGYRLGFGGGYYDATLAHYREKKDILAVGLAYAQQACLFNLPVEEHDIKMDWIITEQGAQHFE